MKWGSNTAARVYHEARHESLDKRYNHSYTKSMKTAVSIPDALFDAAERLAKRLGVSRSELYQRAVHRYLTEQGDEVIRERLDRLYGGDTEGSRLDPAIEYLQNASLPGDEW